MLIVLKPGKTKGFCENKVCKKRLIGPFKVLQRGKGYAYFVCMKCFEAIMKKGIERYLPGGKSFDLSETVKRDGLHAPPETVRLVDATEKPYIPTGAQFVGKPVEIAQNSKTGQIIL